MATAAQVEANRRNAKKSTGPRTTGGKKKSRMNSLKHGLRSDQVVLPGESAEEFHAELKGWADDWKPTGHTAAVLCERAAVASWRLRRCVRAEADLLLGLADRRARRRLGLDDGGDRDGGRGRDPALRAEDVAESLLAEPARTVAELRSFPEGVDRLIAEWGDLAEALDVEGPRRWRVAYGHELVMALLGRDPESDPAPAGPLAVDSRRLARANDPDDDDDDEEDDAEAGPMSDAEAEATAARVLREIERRREALRAHRATLAAAPAEAEDKDEGEGDGVPDDDLKFLGVTKQIMLLHRYEMANERSMRAAMKDLVALEKAGPGAGRGADKSAEVVEVKKVEDRPSEPSSRPEPTASPAPSEPNPPAPREVPSKARRDRKGRTWPVEPAGGGGSPS